MEYIIIATIITSYLILAIFIIFMLPTSPRQVPPMKGKIRDRFIGL